MSSRTCTQVCRYALRRLTFTKCWTSSFTCLHTCQYACRCTCRTHVLCLLSSICRLSHTHTQVHTHARAYVPAHGCMYVYTRAHTHICTHVYAHIQASSIRGIPPRATSNDGTGLGTTTTSKNTTRGREGEGGAASRVHGSCLHMRQENASACQLKGWQPVCRSLAIMDGTNPEPWHTQPHALTHTCTHARMPVCACVQARTMQASVLACTHVHMWAHENA